MILHTLLLILFIFFALTAALFAVALILVIQDSRSLSALLGNSAGGLGAAAVGFFGLLALVVAVPLLDQHEGWPRLIMVLINLVVQPVCGLLAIGGAYQFVLGLSGQLTYGFRRLSINGFDADRHRRLVRDRIVGGLFCLIFFAGLGLICLWPWL